VRATVYKRLVVRVERYKIVELTNGYVQHKIDVVDFPESEITKERITKKFI